MTDFNKDFTHTEVEQLCKEYNRNIKDFYKFMAGQTFTCENGENVYFGRDVRKFFSPNRTSLTDILVYEAMNYKEEGEQKSSCN
jgi:hypothetical protein